MKHFLTILLIIVIIAGAMVITCPDKARHIEEIEEIIDNSISQDDTGIAALFSALGGKKLILNVIDPFFNVDNYFIVSIGRIRLNENESKTVSVGLLGHVFTIDKDKAKQMLKEQGLF